MHSLEQLRSGALVGTRRLDLSCGLQTLPPEVFDLADTLEVLNLSGNQLTDLPHHLTRLHRLKVVFASNNPLAHVPEVLGECPALQVVGFKSCRIRHVPAESLPPALRWLILTDNALAQLPRAVGERPALQKLMLAGNQLRDVPEALVQAGQLELIRLAANQLQVLPSWLLELPRLAWLALAGNPLGWSATQPPQELPAVPWSTLRVDALLGEGASGHIYRVQPQGSGPALALKLFKGAITSDGLPEQELAASLAAGQHPALCTPCGQLQAHPQGQQGLLLPLVDASFTNLAGPPSLESCTRDVYPADLQLTPAQALHIAAQIASAVAHLHQRAVLHGDVYAHNILWNPGTGAALLSDFGAATRLPATQRALCDRLQAIEVRALGYLLQELHSLSASPQGSEATQLARLAADCLNDNATLRPSAQAVALQLAQI
jgi:hypothetical protein